MIGFYHIKDGMSVCYENSDSLEQIACSYESLLEKEEDIDIKKVGFKLLKSVSK